MDAGLTYNTVLGAQGSDTSLAIPLGERVVSSVGAHQRSALLAVDAIAWILATVLAGALWNTAHVTPTITGILMVSLAAVSLQAIIGKPIYSGVYPVGSKDEVFVLARTVGIVSSILSVVLVLIGSEAHPVALVVLGALGALFIASAPRLAWRTLRERAVRPEGAEPVLIVGAGNAGTQLISTLLSDPRAPYLPVGLLDDDPAKQNLRLRGVPVMGNRTSLASATKATGAKRVIIAVPSAGSELFRDVAEQSKQLGLTVKVLPTLREIFAGQVDTRDLRDIDITDLLGRDRVNTGVERAAGYLGGRRVLVTGAGGSIGSELCRQVLRFEPSQLFMLDRDESALQALQLSIAGHGLLNSEDVVLADIRDRDALQAVFSRTRPDVVFHAAALKHLPMLERYPEEAWKTNVLGTANVLEAATDAGVEVFVNISTDKAANPTSILGFSKRTAERLTADMARRNSGKFVSVRFGNVLGSRGSVLPAFTEQIRMGGPITVTHPDVTRFFMMIPEACELVIHAAALGSDGEAMVLDMGQPVRILDVARQMIEMSGRSDIEIVFAGLRPGEKMHEELFGRLEGQFHTSHPMIDSVSVPPLPIEDVRRSAMEWDDALEKTP